MQVTPVDPRDMRWEQTPRAYRVDFWRRLAPPPDVAADAMGWASDEYELTGADVAEVLSWASARCGPDRIFTLYAVLEDDRGGPGLVPLLGEEPTR